MLQDYSFLEGNESQSNCVKTYNLGKSNPERVFLYKLRRMQTDAGTEEAFFQMQTPQEVREAKQKGVIYDPGSQHTWQSNISWILGIVHTKREVTVYSEMMAKNIWRKDVIPKKESEMTKTPFSAFVREIAALVKAGYEFELRNDGFIYMNCKRAETSHLKISDIDPTQVEVEECLKKIIGSILNKIDENFSGIGGREHYSAFSSYIEYCKTQHETKNNNNDDDDPSNANEFLSKLDDWLIESYNSSFKEKMSLLSQIKLISDFASAGHIYQEAARGPKIIEDFKKTRLEYDESLAPQKAETQNTI